MTVREYNDKVEKIISNSDGKVNGLALTSEIGISVSNINGKPALMFCKVDAKGNPIELIQCLTLDNPKIVRRLQVWLDDAITVFKFKSIQESDANILVSGDNEELDNN